MKSVGWTLGVWVLGFYTSVGWGQKVEPDLWPVVAGDPIESCLDGALFDGESLPGGIAALLDRQGPLAVVTIGRVDRLVDGSSHLLDFAAKAAYHIRPAHVLASARLSPDRSQIAAVLLEPFDHAIMLYRIADGQARRLANVQASAGSVRWVDDSRLAYRPWREGQPGREPVVVDLAQAAIIPPAVCPVSGQAPLAPMVACCGGTCDDYNCGGSNPYPCCTNGGNCTWWSWDRACRNWDRALPGWGDAHSWVSNAQSDGYPTGTTPQVGSIACDSNNTLSQWGHVVWVLQVTSTQIYVSEQGCGGGYGDNTRWYNRSVFDGYIYDPNPNDPPQITQHPQAQGLCPGAAVTFTVAATGQTPLSYQWQKNGSNLSNAGHYSGVTTTGLTVTGADATDVASYRCVVTNSVGSATSNAASLTLKALTAITQQPQDLYNVVPGSTVSFAVTATGAGTITYQWQKNGANLSNGGRISGATSRILQITVVGATDVASYRCLVSADCGSKTSDAAILNLGPRPIPGDFDGDRDVDLTDFGFFQTCLTGSSSQVSGPPCDQADLNSDRHVNGIDLNILVTCMTGEGVEGNPNCSGL